MAQRKPRDNAWLPVSYSPREVEALQALRNGKASESQQKTALDWIVQTAAGTYELSYRSDSDGGERETSFAEGRRFVGLSVVKLLSLTPGAIQAMRTKEKPTKE